MITFARRIKIVIDFTLNRSEAQIRDYLNNIAWPILHSKIDDKVATIFNPGYIVSAPKLKLVNFGNNEWQIYPKFGIEGTSNLTEEQFRLELSNLLSDLKLILKQKFDSQGATNIVFHINYPDRRTRSSDEI